MVRQRKTGKKLEGKSGTKANTTQVNTRNTYSRAWNMLKILFTILALIYVFLPLVLSFVPRISQQLLFLNLYHSENEAESLKHPTTQYNLEGTASFHINCGDVKLGAWHVLPKSVKNVYGQDEVVGGDVVSERLSGFHSPTIIIYHHGAGMTRATGDNKQRPEVYKLFQMQEYHTIAFDYRGFGDSTGWPSETGLLNDSLCVLEWVQRSTSKDAKVLFWGHSLGAAIASLAARKSFEKCDKNNIGCTKIDGLILEGGFTNVRKGAADNSFILQLMNFYSKFVLEKALDLAFTLGRTSLATDQNLPYIKCPIMLLYAEDDDIIPCKHGEELFNISKREMKHNRKVTFVKFKVNHGYGHLGIYKAPELPQLIEKFMVEQDFVHLNL